MQWTGLKALRPGFKSWLHLAMRSQAIKLLSLSLLSWKRKVINLVSQCCYSDELIMRTLLFLFQSLLSWKVWKAISKASHSPWGKAPASIPLWSDSSSSIKHPSFPLPPPHHHFPSLEVSDLSHDWNQHSGWWGLVLYSLAVSKVSLSPKGVTLRRPRSGTILQVAFVLSWA